MADLTTEELLAQPSGPASGAPSGPPRDLSTEELLAQPVPGAPGMLESFGRGALSGAAFGFEDELGIADRQRQLASARANPWTHFAGELVGGIVPMVAAGGVGTLARGTSLAARGVRAVASALSPSAVTSLPGAIGQGVKLGATYGALSGAGHAAPAEDASWASALAQRAAGAGTGATLGAVLGVPAGILGHGISRVAQAVGGARAAAAAETEDAGRGALHALARTLQRDRITPDDLVAQIRSEFPTDTATAGGLGYRWWGGGPGGGPRQPWTADMVEDVVRRGLAGESAANISAALRGAGGGSGPGEGAVATLLGELAERHAVPLNLIDRAKLMGAGAGENTGWLARAAAATRGEASAVARESLIERQLGQGGRLSEAITRYIGTPDFEARSAQLAREVADRNDALYGAARDADVLTTTLAGRTIGDAIQGVLDSAAVRWAFQRGPVASAIGRAIEAFRPGIRPGDTARRAGTAADRPIASLDEFMQAKQNLQALFDESQNNPTVRRALTQFRDELYDAVGTHNPQWRIANNAAADGFAAQRALNLGMEYGVRLGPLTREQLARYRAMSPPEQELFRIGVAQRLHDRIMNRQSTHDLTSELRLPGARQALRTILGDDVAASFFRRIDREFATTRTYREQFGSQTTPLKEAIEDLNWAPRFEASWSNLGLGSILRLAQEYAARTINAARNERLMRLMTEMDPVQQLRILEGVRGVHGARSRAASYFGAPQRPMTLAEFASIPTLFRSSGFNPIAAPAPLAGHVATLRETNERRPLGLPYYRP